ncbi:MAG: hypothetical protein JNL11_16065 [Bdellovibrionaceae bacterium]|nr:hypothetical protein [Pseudobdellovibrionaceae bacterium]
MKSYVSNILIIATFLFAHSSLATQKFEFKYSFQGEKLAVSQEASDYYQALEKAAKSCFRHFKHKTKSNQEKGIDLIDVCANPQAS